MAQRLAFGGIRLAEAEPGGCFVQRFRKPRPGVGKRAIEVECSEAVGHGA
jgi:hypothetical protein